MADHRPLSTVVRRAARMPRVCGVDERIASDQAAIFIARDCIPSLPWSMNFQKLKTLKARTGGLRGRAHQPLPCNDFGSRVG